MDNLCQVISQKPLLFAPQLESSLEPHPEEEEEHEAGLDKPGRGVGQDGAEGSPEAVKRDNKTWVLEGMASGRLTPEDDRSIDESPHTNMKFVMNVPVDAA